MAPARAPPGPRVPPAADVRSAPPTFDPRRRDRASRSRASGSASPPIQARPPFPAPWARSLSPHSRLLGKASRGTSAPPPGPAPGRGAQLGPRDGPRAPPPRAPSAPAAAAAATAATASTSFCPRGRFAGKVT
nr:formin-like protein 18 [Equus asinus]